MSKSRIDSFDLRPGRKIGSRYVVVNPLGRGSEGEVYRIRELDTDIHRAAKLYYPHRNPGNRAVVGHARKLHKLRHCPIVLQYHHSERITVQREPIVVMISELCEGEPLEQWVARHRGKRLLPYRALSVVHQLVRGLEAVHALGEYHADVHTGNILIRPSGVRFEMKLVDFYDWGRPTRDKQRQDVMDCIGVLLELCGGRKHYANLPDEIKHIIANQRRDLVLRRFRRLTDLRQHLESFEWRSVL